MTSLLGPVQDAALLKGERPEVQSGQFNCCEAAAKASGTVLVTGLLRTGSCPPKSQRKGNAALVLHFCTREHIATKAAIPVDSHRSHCLAGTLRVHPCVESFGMHVTGKTKSPVEPAASGKHFQHARHRRAVYDLQDHAGLSPRPCRYSAGGTQRHLACILEAAGAQEVWQLELKEGWKDVCLPSRAAQCMG